MNYQIKRFLLGTSTILLAGIAYTKGQVLPTATPDNFSKPVQANDAKLKTDLHTVEAQVQQLQQKVQTEALKTKSQTSFLKTLQSQERSLKAQAIAVAEQQALAAEERAQAAALAQSLAAQRNLQPPVQTVTRASGHDGDDGSGDD